MRILIPDEKQNQKTHNYGVNLVLRGALHKNYEKKWSTYDDLVKWLSIRFGYPPSRRLLEGPHFLSPPIPRYEGVNAEKERSEVSALTQCQYKIPWGRRRLAVTAKPNNPFPVFFFFLLFKSGCE